MHPGDQDHVDVLVDEQFATIGHNPTTVRFSDLDLLRPVDNQCHRHDVVAEADPLEMETATTPQAHEPDPQSMHRKDHRKTLGQETFGHGLRTWPVIRTFSRPLLL